MEIKTRSVIVVVLLVTSALVSVLGVQTVRASSTVYIHADGAIDPPDVAMTHDGPVYRLTGNLNSSMTVEADNIIIDGGGHALQGSSGPGIMLEARTNVTIENMRIIGFDEGIYMVLSSNISVHSNLLSNNDIGIDVRASTEMSSEIVISENNVTGSRTVAISLDGSVHSSLLRNNISLGYFWGDGIRLSYSSNNVVSFNNVSTNQGDGIGLYLSGGNIISSNFVFQNNVGIAIRGMYDTPPYTSSNNTLRNNVLVNNYNNFGIDGFDLQAFVQDIDTSNIVDGKPIYYLINQSHLAVPSDAGYVGIINSTDITVRGLNVRRNAQGVLLAFTTDSRVSGNNITENWWGVQLLQSSGITVFNNSLTGNFFGMDVFRSSQNIITANKMTSNDMTGLAIRVSSNNDVYQNDINSNMEFGIQLVRSDNNVIRANNVVDNYFSISIGSSYGNRIYHNNFVNRVYGRNLYPQSNGVNQWDNGYPSGGNYWSNYTGIDLHSGLYQNETGGDGFGDNGYLIYTNNTDRYPLMHPWVKLVGDLNEDNKIDIRDLAQCGLAFGSYESGPRWNFWADLNFDGKIDIRDLVLIAKNFGRHYP